MLTNTEKEKIEKWLIANVDETSVPADEGNGDALVYNLVHLLRGDNCKYNYELDQDQELVKWGLWSIEDLNEAHLNNQGKQ